MTGETLHVRGRMYNRAEQASTARHPQEGYPWSLLPSAATSTDSTPQIPDGPLKWGTHKGANTRLQGIKLNQEPLAGGAMAYHEMEYKSLLSIKVSSCCFDRWPSREGGSSSTAVMKVAGRCAIGVQ
jgi:hypothetical protein